MYMASNGVSPPPQTLTSTNLYLLDNDQANGFEVLTHGFICSSLMIIYPVEYIFLYPLIVFFVASFEKMSVQDLCPFFN